MTEPLGEWRKTYPIRDTKSDRCLREEPRMTDPLRIKAGFTEGLRRTDTFREELRVTQE